jgi:Tfp pilus assembly protein PilO
MAGLLIAVMGVANFFLVVSPHRHTASGLRQQASSLTNTNEALSNQISMLQAEVAKLPEVRQRISDFQTHIPSSVQLPALSRQLTALAKSTGTDEPNISPGSLTQVGGKTTGGGSATASSVSFLPIQVTVTGNYWQLYQFVDGLEGMARNFEVVGVSVTLDDKAQGTDAHPKLKAVISGQVFTGTPAAAGSPQSTTSAPTAGSSASTAPSTSTGLAGKAS